MRFILYTLLFASIVIAPSNVGAQEGDLRISDVENGFVGTFTSAGLKRAFSSQQLPDRSLKTRILDPNGNLIAQALYADDLVTVTLAGVSLKIYTDKESLKAKRAPELSPADITNLETYRLSNESEVIRRLIFAVIKARVATSPGSLKGMLILSLVLGDGPGMPSDVPTTSKASNCKIPRTLQIYASYFVNSPRPKGTSRNGSGAVVCNSENCCGCCGVGCYGCTGCYTSARYAHDVCVDLYGQPMCIGLLADAVASIVNECPIN